MDPHHLDADADWDLTFHPDADPDPDRDPSFKIKAHTLEKVLKEAHIPYILAWHLQINGDPDPGIRFRIQLTLMRMRIQVTKIMRIRIHNTAK